MSLNKANADDYEGLDSVWATCPADVLLEVLKKLDIPSLVNCMDVNIYWRNLVEYYCEHANLWKEIVMYAFDDEGATLTEKSNLNWQDQYKAAQRWLNIKNVYVTLRHCYKCKTNNIRNICVQRDNLIINNTCSVNHYDINKFTLIKSHQPCFKYEETSSMIVALELDVKNPSLGINLFLTSRLNKKTVSYQLYHSDLFRVYMNRCYFIDIKNVLWMYTASDGQGKPKFLARYYGSYSELCGIHIDRHNVYVLSRNGDVLRVDMECRKFEIFIHVNNFYERPELFNLYYMLHIYHYKLQGPGLKKIEEFVDRHIMTNAPHKRRVSCVLEHGLAVILGYEDGKIEIYHKRTFGALAVPEMQFNIQSYSDEIPLGITAIDVYEDELGHHLFVATLTNVYELLLYYH